MNWYKKLLYAGNERIFTVREFLSEMPSWGLKHYAADRSGSGSKIRNMDNGLITDFHYHRIGEEIPVGKMKKMLKDLGINHREFTRPKSKGQKKRRITEQPEIIQEPQPVEPWKIAPWKLKQDQYLQEVGV